MHITHHSNNVQQSQVAIHVSKLDRLTNRIPIGPVLLHKRLADKRCMGVRWSVGRIKHTPAQQGNTQRREIAGAREPVISTSLLGWIVVDQKRSVWSISRQWQIANDTCGYHSGSRTQTLKQLILKKSVAHFIRIQLCIYVRRIRSDALLH